MTSNRQNGAASIKALIGMLMIGIAAHAGLPYLPLNGPPPVRVAEVKKSPTATVIALEKAAAKNSTNTLAVAKPTASGTTNSTMAITEIPDAPLVGTASATDVTFVAPGGELVAPGMLGITPQMLATYFRPVNFGTNGGVIGGVLPIGFVPPFTRPESSRAEYIVK